ncbi:hypothetical protein ABPG74_012629 [Tetrahymena malaccensis]
MNLKSCLILVLASVFTQKVLADYISLHQCIQNSCFSLYTYCQNETKCKKSYQLVNLCSQVNPEFVDDCIGNIHNYLHISLQQCLTEKCGYNTYYQNCGITNSKIRNCIDIPDSDCYLNKGGKEFKADVDKCTLQNYASNCGKIDPSYKEYVTRCSQLNTLSCYQSSLPNASQTIQQLFKCSSQILKLLLAILMVALLL